jgi:hypothetical protein
MSRPPDPHKNLTDREAHFFLVSFPHHRLSLEASRISTTTDISNPPAQTPEMDKTGSRVSNSGRSGATLLDGTDRELEGFPAAWTTGTTPSSEALPKSYIMNVDGSEVEARLSVFKSQHASHSNPGV